jgi:hypothetical protein
MHHLTSMLMGGLAAVGAWALVTPSSAPAHDESSVNRTAKGDRLAVPRPQRGDQGSVTTVEVVGIHDASVIYRDRDGRILFQTEPVSNRTIVSKGVELPQLTLRETSRSKPILLEVPRGLPLPPPIPQGCDPVVVSWVAQAGLSETLSHQAGRCVT